MAKYLAYEHICPGYEVESEEQVEELARGMVWSEIGTRETEIAYGRHVSTVDGVEIYYDYGADYYFFCPEHAEEEE